MERRSLMPREYQHQTEFNSGELSPLLEGAVRLKKYYGGCRTLENFLIHKHGAISSYPGFQYVCETKYSGRDAILVDFRFSNVQAYQLEFGHQYIRFLKDRGQIENPSAPGTPYEIASPYLSTDLKGLQFARSADVIYIAHSDYPVYKLTRYAHDDWSLDQVVWEDGPYLDENIDGITHLAASATTGTGVTLEASNLTVATDMGTFDLTVGTPEEFLTAGRPFAVFIFEAEGGDLESVTVNVTTGASASDLATAYLYASDGSKATGSALATSGTQDVGTAGEKVFAFSTLPAMTDGATYAIVIGIAATDAAIRADVTSAGSSSYLSGYSATPTGAVTPLSTDWRLKIIYRPVGYPDVFESGHVGSLWRLRHSGDSVHERLVSAGSETDDVEIKGNFYVDASPDNDFVGRVVLKKSFNRYVWYDVASFHYSTKQEFTETADNVWYKCVLETVTSGGVGMTIAQNERWGVVRITGVSNGHTATVDVVSPLGSTDPTPTWREGAWSGVRGYPKAVAFHSSRMVFASTDYQPYSVWFSWSSDYERFVPGGDTEDAAFSITLNVVDNRIEWLRSLGDLIVGTLGEEVEILPVKSGVLSGSNLDIVLKSTTGSATGLRPMGIGSSIVFLQRSRRKLIALGYSLESDSLTANDLTEFSEHITQSGILSVAYQQEPYSIIHCVLSNGDMVDLAYSMAQNVVGWSRRTTEGDFLWVSTIPSSMGGSEGTDETWVITDRTIGGARKRFIEVVADNSSASSADEYVCLDCSLSGSVSPPSNTFTGLDHLEGHSVSVVADGWYVGECTVASGRITLPDSLTASTVCAGLKYTSVVQPMSIEAGAQDGTAQARTKKILRVYGRFLNTLCGKYGALLSSLYPIKTFVPDVTLMEAVPTLKRGHAELTWPGDWSDDAAPYIVQDQPYPMTLLGLVTVVQTND
jgi:hypothetical protein